MEEQTQKECKTKHCCGKCIIVVIICSLVCFFIGYYAGSKSLAKVSGAAINRPFNPGSLPRIPTPTQMKAIKSLPRTNNLPNMQRPPIPNIKRPPVSPQTQAPKVNIPDSVKEKAQAQAKANTEQKK